MDRSPVESTILVSVGYDAGAEILEIEFASGRIYQFFEVPESVATWLLQVPKKGSFFNRKIKDVYRYKDVTPPDDDTPLIDQLEATVAELERGR